MTSALEPHSLVVRKQDTLNAAVGDDLVILNSATNHFVGLDDIGRHIWELLETPVRIDELCQRLAAAYAASRDEIDRDVRLFLAELREEGLVNLLVAG